MIIAIVRRNSGRFPLKGLKVAKAYIDPYDGKKRLYEGKIRNSVFIK